MLSRSFPIKWYLGTSAQQRRKVGLSLLVSCLIVFIMRDFFREQGVVKTALQVDFERYVEHQEKGGASLPKIHVTIQSAAEATPRVLMLDGDKVTRVLSLARESGVFGLNHKSAIVGDGVVLRVEDGEKNFTTTFSREDISHNIKAESLLKLLTIHGKPVT